MEPGVLPVRVAGRGNGGGPGHAVSRVQPARPSAVEKNSVGRYRRPGPRIRFTTVNEGAGREETRWRYTMEPSSSGTLLTECFQFLWCSVSNRIAEALLPRGRQVNQGIEETLRRIKQAAEHPPDR